MCLHIPLEEGGDEEGNVHSTSCCVSRLPVRRHRGNNHADALYIAERESANVRRKRSSVPRSPALLAVRKAGQQTRPTATPPPGPYAQAASGSPGFVGKQDADLPLGGGLCWRGDTGMRGELDRGDDVSSGHLVYPSPAILRCTVCLSLDGRRTLRWRKWGFWMVAERDRHPLLGVTFFAQLREI